MKIYDECNGFKLLTTEAQGADLPRGFSTEVMDEVVNFHMSVEGYRATPLVELDELAKYLGIKKVFVKDESFRFGLNAFKGLGASYAIAKIICEKLGKSINEVNFQYLKSKEVNRIIGDMTFTTASDGNHGRALAWAASHFGCRSVIYLNKGTSKSRVDAVREVGGEAHVTDVNYDDTVRHATIMATENGWYLVQDTAFDDYVNIPTWISQGYATMGVEALDQLNLVGIKKPTHVILQAGVGAMAGGVLGYMVNKYNGNHPHTMIVEPLNAACYYKSAHANDGQRHFVNGDMETIMVGLACGEPNPITWDVIRKFAQTYVQCEDSIAARGMRILGNPIGRDTKVVSGESGAIGVGVITALLRDQNLSEAKEAIGIDENSVVLIFSTEGDTDPDHYKKIVHDGLYS